MTNFDIYKDELIDMLVSNSTCEQLRELMHDGVRCNGIDCTRCMPKLIQWLNEDVEDIGTKARRTMTRKALLEAAERVVTGDREDDYGAPEQNFSHIADLGTAYLLGGVHIKPHDVAAMMALLKIARVASGQHKNDNWIDIAGYAACGAELQDSY